MLEVIGAVAVRHRCSVVSWRKCSGFDDDDCERNAGCADDEDREAKGLCFARLEFSRDMLIVGLPRSRFARMMASKRRMLQATSAEGEAISRSEMNSLKACVSRRAPVYSATS